MAVTNTPGMKACPFCGCETVRQFHPFEQRGYIIDCNRCNGGFHNIPKDQAVERWNTRAPSRPADQVPDKVFDDCEDGNEPTEYVRADLIQQQQATIERLSAEKVEIAEQAAQIAENWQSSLRPGNEHRLHGHHEAAHEIAHAIRNTFGKEASDVRAREEDRG